MNASRGRQVAYGIAAAAGLVGTWYFNLRYVGPPTYLAAWFANAASSSAAVDLLVLAAVLSLFMVAEAKRLGLRGYIPVMFIVVGALVAMAFAVPLFLLYRERRLSNTMPKTSRLPTVKADR